MADGQTPGRLQPGDQPRRARRRGAQRALQEIYLPPFKAAVTRAHVSTLMCAYPQLNGAFQCQDPATRPPPPAVGIRRIRAVGPRRRARPGRRPGGRRRTAQAVRRRPSWPALVERAAPRDRGRQRGDQGADPDVRLRAGRPAGAGAPGTPVDSPPTRPSPSHGRAVRRAAEERLGAAPPVRLRACGRWPSSAPTPRPAPVTKGFGWSQVVPPFMSTPLAALPPTAPAGRRSPTSDGGSTTRHLPRYRPRDLTPPPGKGHGLTLHPGPAPVPARPSPRSTRGCGRRPDPAPPAHPATATGPGQPDRRAARSGSRPTTTRTGLRRPRPAGAGATSIVLPAGWTASKAAWTGTLTVPPGGLLHVLAPGPGPPASRWTVTRRWRPRDPRHRDVVGLDPLRAGHPYQLAWSGEPVDDTAHPRRRRASLDLGMAYVGDQSPRRWPRPGSPRGRGLRRRLQRRDLRPARPVAAGGPERAHLRGGRRQPAHRGGAQHRRAGGDAVARQGGRAVIEDWYPGEEDGAAIAAVLFGDGRPLGAPAGHLPGVSMAQVGASTAAQWPGVGLTSTYSEGLEVGVPV